MLIPVTCPDCSQEFERERHKIKAAWVCASCSKIRTGARTALPIGTVRPDRHGYMEIKTAAGWIRRHRYLMEQHLGRPLLPSEYVVYRNAIHGDDRIENLELRDRHEFLSASQRGMKRSGPALQNIRAASAYRSNVRLNAAVAASIRLRAKLGETHSSIARDLGVHKITVGRIVRGEAWLAANHRNTNQEAQS